MGPFVCGGKKGIESMRRGDRFWDARLFFDVGCTIMIVVATRLSDVRGRRLWSRRVIPIELLCGHVSGMTKEVDEGGWDAATDL